MRILLAYLFFTPLAAMYAVQQGAQQVTPLILAISLVAVVAQIALSLRSARLARA